MDDGHETNLTRPRVSRAEPCATPDVRDVLRALSACSSRFLGEQDL